MPFRIVFVLIIVITALVMDLKNSQIDNRWLVLSAAVSLLLNISENGFRGIVDSFLGGALPLLMLFGLFYFHMLGTGDIKLFCVIGILLRPRRILYCMGYSFVFGAIVSLIILLYTGNMRQRLIYMMEYFHDFIRTGTRKPYLVKDMNRIENFHFTIPIMMSVLLYAGGIY